MLRCLVACGTEPTPGARAQEAARLVSQFIGDMCVVALASDDRRSFGPFAVESRDRLAHRLGHARVAASERERAAWPLAGRALISGKPVVIDRIRPGELELLGELGVELAQGFHIGRPRPVEELR